MLPFVVQGKKYSCSLSGNSTVLCAVGNPLTSDDDVRFAVRLDPSKVVATDEKLNITLRVNTWVSFLVCVNIFFLFCSLPGCNPSRKVVRFGVCTSASVKVISILQAAAHDDSGGVRVFAARGKCLCCRPEPRNQISNWYSMVRSKITIFGCPCGVLTPPTVGFPWEDVVCIR